ncbi:MAG: LPS-assembly protein LptD [Myxococcota bacterium]|nr:LPS-assembly protein LptD [Myxococcota bacterium]
MRVLLHAIVLGAALLTHGQGSAQTFLPDPILPRPIAPGREVQEPFFLDRDPAHRYPIEVSADAIQFDAASNRVILRGHVRVRNPEARFSADEAVLHRGDRRLILRGRVRIQQGLRFIAADSAEIDLADPRGRLLDAHFWIKQDLDPIPADWIEQADQTPPPGGLTRYSIQGSEILRTGEKELEISRARFTPCDCKEAKPTWSLGAGHAKARAGQAIVMTNGVLYIKDIPVAWVPWIRFPLARRLTGLLPPRMGVNGIHGYFAEVPVFIAIHESYDATPSIGYYERSGLRLASEFRYAPTWDLGGRWYAALLWDRGGRDPLWRFVVTGDHLHRLSSQWLFRGRMDIASDARWIRQFALGLGERETEYLRSDVEFRRRSHDLSLSIGVFGYQDLRAGHPNLFDRRGLSELNRAPDIQLGVPSTALFGLTALRFSLESGLTAWLDPIRSWNDGGVDGVYPGRTLNYPGLDIGELNGLHDPYEDARRLIRLSLRPELAFWPLRGDAGYLRARAGIHQNLAFSAAPDDSPPQFRLSGLEPRRAFTAQSTPWFDLKGGPVAHGKWGRGVIHELRPAVQWRYVPAVARTSPLPAALDEWDDIQPLHQAAVSLEQRWVPARAHGRWGVLTLAAEQALDIESTLARSFVDRLTPLFLLAGWRMDYWSAQVRSGWDWRREQVNEAAASVTLRDTRNDTLSIQYAWLPRRGRTPWQLRALEAAPPAFNPVRADHGELHQATLNSSVVLNPNFTAYYGIAYSFLDGRVYGHSFGLRFDSPCRCLNLTFRISQLLGRDRPDIGIVLDLSALSVSREID